MMMIDEEEERRRCAVVWRGGVGSEVEKMRRMGGSSLLYDRWRMQR